jgi:hypothetical protein
MFVPLKGVNDYFTRNLKARYQLQLILSVEVNVLDLFVTMIIQYRTLHVLCNIDMHSPTLAAATL